ncbi:MAG: MFS transporter [Dehalococcoidia bacterium]|jgi:cyanate permease|nr:MFS transporter [Dehalococcoidia bacterium]
MDSASTTIREVDPSERGQRWVMLAGLWLAYVSFGMVSGGIPPLVGSVREDLGLSLSAMGSILGAWPLVYVAVSVPAGALIDRFGLRRSLAAGIALVALSGILRAVAVNHATLFLAVAVFGLGGPFISVGAPKLISVWFNRKDRGMAMGVYLTASNIGRILALATANSVLMPLYRSSWRLTLVTYAGVALLTAVVWWVMARDVEQTGEAAQGSGKDFTASMKVFPLLLRIPVVRIVLVVTIGSFFISHGFNNWLPEILRAGGMTAAQAGFWSILPIVVGIATTVVVPLIAKPGRRIPMLVGIFMAAAVAALMVATTTGAPLAVGLILQGAASRGVLPVVLLILMDAPRVGPERMGAAGGLYFTAGEAGGVLGPLFMGVAADLTGGFRDGLLMLMGLSMALALVSLRLGFSLRRQD